MSSAAGAASRRRSFARSHTAVVDAVTTPTDDQAWYLTSDVERCQGSSLRLRTVFIGGTPPAGSIRRCDDVARHVQAAAMEILASEAMPAAD